MSTGNQRNSCCSICVRIVKFIPVFFIIAVILWSYYAYTIQLSFFTIENVFQRIVYLLMFHVVFFMLCWSYWQTIFTDIGIVPTKFRVPRTEMLKLASAENEEAQKRILENFAKDLPVLNRTLTGAVRYCDKCQHIKPDRCHHCSVCGVCVLKMDHHCPWINNCVNFTNYKYFILFLGYALLYCLYVGLTSLEFFVLFWRGELEGMGRFHILFLFFVSVMFAISLVSLFGYHIYLVLLNRSTLEAFRAPVFRSTGTPDKNGFSLGKAANFQEVFGDDKGKWFLPVFTSLGDGSQYPTQIQHQIPNTYESMGDTPARLDRISNNKDAVETSNLVVNKITDIDNNVNRFVDVLANNLELNHCSSPSAHLVVANDNNVVVVNNKLNDLSNNSNMNNENDEQNKFWAVKNGVTVVVPASQNDNNILDV